MDCGSSCIKYLLFIFNFVFVLCGLALLIPSIIVETNIGSIDGKTAEHVHQIQGAAIALIVVGSIIFVIAFFGCCGAIRESHCMIVTYAVFLLTILVIQVGISIFAFVSLRNINSNTIANAFKESVSSYWSNNGISTGVDFVQETLQCCGADGPRDYYNITPNNGTIPWSCCTIGKENNHAPCNGKELYSEGCAPVIARALKSVGQWSGGIALGIAGVELVGIIFALCLANSIRNEDRRNYRV